MFHMLYVAECGAVPPVLGRLLAAEPFQTTVVRDGRAALQELAHRPCDCILLEVTAPAPDGFSCCRRIRETSHVPLILLSSHSDTMHKVLGLEAGADDYVTIPYDPREVLARVRAVLRGRGEYAITGPATRLTVGPITVDLLRRTVTRSGEPLPLTPREYALFLSLARQAGQAVERERLFETVWGYDVRLGGKLLEVYIRRLRHKLEPDGTRPVSIQTVRGYGYRLAMEESGGHPPLSTSAQDAGSDSGRDAIPDGAAPRRKRAG